MKKNKKIYQFHFKTKNHKPKLRGNLEAKGINITIYFYVFINQYYFFLKNMIHESQFSFMSNFNKF